MSVIFLWENLLLPNSTANVILVKSIDSGGYILNHTTCGENFRFINKEITTECPHCKGDIIFPR